MASGTKKGTQIYFSFLSKVLGKWTPYRFPNRAPMESKAHLQCILHISQKPYLLGSPVKEPSVKVPYVDSLAERCPTTRALLCSAIKVPGIWAPPQYHVPFGCSRLAKDLYICCATIFTCGKCDASLVQESFVLQQSAKRIHNRVQWLLCTPLSWHSMLPHHCIV
jgi:hypothetical protein